MSSDTSTATAGTDAALGSYIYGVIPAGTRIPDGLEPVPVSGPGGAEAPADAGGELGLVTEGDVAAVVSDVGTDRPLGTRDDLLAHERVLNAIAAETTILPMRFGAVVTDDDAVAEELLAPHRAYFVEALGRMDGLVQFSVRGDYDQDEILARVVEEDESIERLRARIAEMDEDAAYYERIKLGEAVSQALERLRAADTDAVVAALSPHAREVAVKEVGGEYGAVHVACLVAREAREGFERAVDDLADAWAARTRLRLIGPTAVFDFVPEYREPGPDGG